MFRNASKSLTTSDEVYEYALSLLDRREHGEKELVQNARRVFESWRARKVYGRLHLQAELIKKQVSEAYIPVILSMLSEEEESWRVQAAYRQITGRRDKKYDCTTEKGMAALARYFSARGFGPSMIRVGLALAKEEAGTVWQEK